jgi:PAS domain S-box-containing protein
MNASNKRQGYAIAVGLSLVVLIARYALKYPLGEQALLLPFALAVIVAAWRGGIGPGLLATAVGTLLGIFFLFPPHFSWAIAGIEYVLDAVVFAIIGVIVSVLCEALHAARRRELDDQFRLLADTIPQLVWMARPNGERFWFNRRCYEFTGADPGQLDDHRWQQVHAADELPRVASSWQSAVQAEHTWEQTLRLRRYDGQFHWFLCRAVPIRDPDGGIRCWFATKTDITAQKEAELALFRINETLEERVSQRTADLHRQAEQLTRSEQELAAKSSMLQAILDAAPDAIITIDRSGTIVSVNRATERMFGYAEREIIGQKISILMPPPYCGEYDRYLARFLQTHEPHIIGIGREVPAQRKDGSTFSADLAVREVDHVDLFTGIVRDISGRKRLQREILEIAADEDRRIGHELHDNTQQQLTGLGLLAQSLAENLGGKSLPEASVAARLAKGINETARQVRLLSRGMVPVDIDAGGLRAALADLASTIGANYVVNCGFRCDGQVEVADNFVATHLYRIAQEAVNNAVKHSRAQRIDISLVGSDEATSLTVVDDGVGLANNTESGPGLGLRIMRYRADLIGSSLQIRSSPEQGTVVECVVGQNRGMNDGRRQHRDRAKGGESPDRRRPPANA